MAAGPSDSLPLFLAACAAAAECHQIIVEDWEKMEVGGGWVEMVHEKATAAATHPPTRPPARPPARPPCLLLLCCPLLPIVRLPLPAL